MTRTYRPKPRLPQGKNEGQGLGHGSQGHGSSAISWILAGRPYDTSSIDSQFTDVEEELTVMDVEEELTVLDVEEELAVLVVEEELTVMDVEEELTVCLLYTSPSPRDRQKSRMPSSA